MRNHQYNALYWGSASYFYRADKQLEKEGKISLTQVIKRYQTCCRSKNESLLEIIKSFNRISESEIFTELMIQYRTLPARIIMRNF
jgi:myo-inositol catabolism protein IolC